MSAPKLVSHPSPRPAESWRGRVLLVDDDVHVLHAWRRVLRTAGFAVEILDDSLALPALLHRESFEAVVTDIRMTGLDGFGVLRAVREAAPEVPVVLATGSADLRSAILAVETGAFRYLQKPVGAKELSDTVGEAVRMQRMSRAREEAFRVVGEETAEARARARVELGETFDRALEQRYMAYQPMCDRLTGEPWAYEALLRTTEKQLASPLDFLSAAEDLDRLVDLGRAVRNDVAFAVARVPEGRSLFVNLHPRDLQDEDLYDQAAPLARVAPRVVLEITERASLSDVPELSSRLERLRALGFRIAVDDLGAGYAGLASFARLRPEVVKIDMSLVRGVECDPIRQKLVDSITRASHDLGILVVAEGIETPAERDTLAALEVDLLQGYLFGRPERAFAP